MTQYASQDDFVAQGFHRLDDHLIEKRPPKIKWGKIYQGLSDPEKIEYLEKLAASMNHAAHLIQSERNELGELCALKEKQLEAMKKSMAENHSMVQSEISKMNEERQRFNSTKAGLRGDALRAKLKAWQS